MTYITICVFSFLATVNTSKFTVAVTVIGKEFGTDPTKTGYLLSFTVLTLGLGNLFWVIAIRIVGRRPMYLLAIPLVMVTNIWSYFAGNFASLLAASILSGFGSAAAEAPTSAVVADLFFVHQRGTVMMIFHLALSFGFFLGPFLNSYVLQYSGWRWICGWLAVATGITWLVAIFTIHETAYRHRDVNAPRSSYNTKRKFRHNLSPSLGWDKQANFRLIVWNTISIISYPSVTWAGCTVGAFVGW